MCHCFLNHKTLYTFIYFTGLCGAPSEFRTFVPFTPSTPGSGWRAQLQPNPSAQLANYEFDVLISAAGGKFVPEGECSFPLRKPAWAPPGLARLLHPSSSCHYPLAPTSRLHSARNARQTGHRHHGQLCEQAHRGGDTGA